jgi:hypothetical protein
LISKTAKWAVDKFDFQVGNEMGSLEDLIDYQEGREEIPYFQVGKGEEKTV